MRVFLIGLVLVTCTFTSAKAKDEESFWQEEVLNLGKILHNKSKTKSQNTFFALNSDKGQAYVQCRFLDLGSTINCEASSGYYGPKNALVLSKEEQHFLEKEGFAQLNGKGNYIFYSYVASNEVLLKTLNHIVNVYHRIYKPRGQRTKMCSPLIDMTNVISTKGIVQIDFDVQTNGSRVSWYKDNCIVKADFDHSVVQLTVEDHVIEKTNLLHLLSWKGEGIKNPPPLLYATYSFKPMARVTLKMLFFDAKSGAVKKYDLSLQREGIARHKVWTNKTSSGVYSYIIKPYVADGSFTAPEDHFTYKEDLGILTQNNWRTSPY